MSVIVLLIVAGGAVAAGFLGAFIWAVQSGQFDDTCTPAVRLLLDEPGPGVPTPRVAGERNRDDHGSSSEHRAARSEL